MLETFRNAWKVQDIRKKLLFTLFIIILYRIGVQVTVPFLDTTVLKNLMDTASNDGSIMNTLDMFSGGALSKATIFSLSITPYINASIIIQLLTYAIPPLERLSKEGTTGRKKINTITRFLSLVLAIAMSIGYYFYLKNNHVVISYTGFEKVFAATIIIALFTAGASIIIWLGDRITEKGIGNGISMILFAGIIARIPSDIKTIWDASFVNGTTAKRILVPIIFVIFILMIGFIVLMNNAERRIPIQYAKRVVGRKMYGGQNTHIPVKVAMSGVMPIIFAMSFMQIPSILDMFWKADLENPQGFYDHFIALFKTNSWFYAILYFLLIIAFNYFYVSMQYNPIEIANNLRQNNGGIPGIRPGRPTSDFISRVLSKITILGAFFLGIIAVFPIAFERFSGIAVSLGGTSILIVVSVALETMRTLESQLMMRHHKGFLE